MSKSYRFSFLWVVFFLVISGVTRATLVMPMNIEQIAGDAEYIIKATVTDKQTLLDTYESGKIVTYYTVHVIDWLKGTPQQDNELVFKQIGQGEYTVDGKKVRQQFFFPEYEVGKTYVLCLPQAHETTGLLAPVGLQQGVFEIKVVDGEEVVPQFKERARTLQKGLSGSQGKFLTTKIQGAANDHSYETFKETVQNAL
jgi:hypothetical protein